MCHDFSILCKMRTVISAFWTPLTYFSETVDCKPSLSESKWNSDRCEAALLIINYRNGKRACGEVFPYSLKEIINNHLHKMISSLSATRQGQRSRIKVAGEGEKEWEYTCLCMDVPVFRIEALRFDLLSALVCVTVLCHCFSTAHVILILWKFVTWGIFFFIIYQGTVPFSPRIINFQEASCCCQNIV